MTDVLNPTATRVDPKTRTIHMLTCTLVKLVKWVSDLPKMRGKLCRTCGRLTVTSKEK